MRDITYTTVRTQVELIDTGDGRYDIDAITDELIDRHGLVDIDEIDEDEVWQIIASHELPEEPTSAERIRTQLQAAMARTSPAGMCTIRLDDVTLTMQRWGVGYRPDLPEILGEATLTTPDGESVTVAADQLTWERLAEMIAAAQDQYEAVATTHRLAIVDAQRAVERAERALRKARARRQDAYRDAERAGLTRYRISQLTGTPERTVGRIIGTYNAS